MKKKNGVHKYHRNMTRIDRHQDNRVKIGEIYTDMKYSVEEGINR